MILDERTYAIHPQFVKDYLAIYVAEGMALQISHLGDLVGWFTTDAGVHMWRYADMGDRERRRAAMDADPEWQVFRKRTSHFVQSMRSRILRPTDFSPMR
jgi:hypothetical protein